MKRVCFRIASALATLALTASMAAVALAQADDGTTPINDPLAVASSFAAPATDQAPVVPTLLLTLVTPVEQDIEVPVETAQLTIRGTTLPGAVVSVGDNLVDTDDQGNFADLALLDQGANEIDVVASDDQGNQVGTSIFVTRGE